MAWHLEITEGPQSGAKLPLDRQGAVIGRDPARCALVLTGSEVSRLHARVTPGSDGSVELEDLGSTHGTFVNGQQISGKARLGPADSVLIGSSRLRLLEAPSLHEGQEPMPLQRFLTIGREPGQDLVLNHPGVSRVHARIEGRGGVFFLTDLESAHGTYLNGQRVKGTVELVPFSRIRIHDFSYLFDGKHLFDEQGAVVARLSPQEQQPAPSLSYVQALKAPFEGEGGLRWLLGSLLSAIPIVAFFTDGYRYKLFQKGFAGEVAMPPWEEWGDLFLKGLLFFLVRFFYMLLPFMFTLFFMVLMAGSPGSEALLITAILVNTILIALVGFVLPMSLAHFAATEDFYRAFHLSTTFQNIKEVWGQYLTIVFLLLGLWVVVLLLSLIPYVGMVFLVGGMFYIYIVSGLLFGEAYRRSQALGL